MTKKMLVLAVTIMMVFASIMPVLADSIITITGTDDATIDTDVIAFTTFELDGTDQVDLEGSTGVWTAVDARGTGAGWYVTIVASTPTSTVGDHEIDVANFEMTIPSVTAVAGNTAPTYTAFASAAALAPVKNMLVAPAGTGMGTYTFTPTFTLDVPAETYAGEYVTTVNITMNQSPLE